MQRDYALNGLNFTASGTARLGPLMQIGLFWVEPWRISGWAQPKTDNKDLSFDAVSFSFWRAKMEDVGVMMTTPMSAYLEQQLQQRFTLFKLWESPSQAQFLTRRGDSVRAVVGDTNIGADSKLIDSLPRLEIVASYSVGLDKIDLDKCRERGIRVTNTPDVLTDDVADLAVGLALATLRRICAGDAFLRSGSWRNGDFQLATKVCEIGTLLK